MKKKYLYLPLMAALAQISHAQLAEIYNAGTGNWEVDSQNATPMKKTSDDSAVNLYPLDGDYADYKILIDNRTYDNVIFGGNGDRSIGGASNGYVIGEENLTPAIQVVTSIGVAVLVVAVMMLFLWLNNKMFDKAERLAAERGTTLPTNDDLGIIPWVKKAVAKRKAKKSGGAQ